MYTTVETSYILQNLNRQRYNLCNQESMKNRVIKYLYLTGVDPEVLKRGFISVKVCVGGHFTDFIYIFLIQYPMKINNLLPNYFIFIGYLKTGSGEGNPSGSATALPLY